MANNHTDLCLTAENSFLTPGWAAALSNDFLRTKFERLYSQDTQKRDGDSDLFIRYENLNIPKVRFRISGHYQSVDNIRIPIPDVVPMFPLPGTCGFDLIMGRLYLDSTHPLSIALQHCLISVEDVYNKRHHGLEAEGLVVRALEREGRDVESHLQGLDNVENKRVEEEEEEHVKEGGRDEDGDDDEEEDDEVWSWGWS
ncbi:hypothetical protein L198_01716 [Cryptococcus wingfieldii CBS 7118]|uniref:Uncharacterized protein n=1 Tax=Cryptococcus wingfieldii CBS 7118 TaxID=1295528 RepID=A0A1E3K038_9TREE|nr:hypothetical protein L198_01716 [Cryptococcus wingfieldii CBS 7118]ODO06484.1 hypothetical protein L198_01716 [Cryptococcus wingfieldii CBS 7118]